MRQQTSSRPAVQTTEGPCPVNGQHRASGVLLAIGDEEGEVWDDRCAFCGQKISDSQD